MSHAREIEDIGPQDDADSLAANSMRPPLPWHAIIAANETYYALPLLQPEDN